MSMAIYVGKDKMDMAAAAAKAAGDKVREAIALRGEARIIVATGASQFEFLAALVKEPGIDWIDRFAARYDRMIWLNPLPEENWEHGYGSETIRIVKDHVPMYRLTLEGLQAGLKSLIAAR